MTSKPPPQPSACGVMLHRLQACRLLVTPDLRLQKACCHLIFFGLTQSRLDCKPDGKTMPHSIKPNAQGCWQVNTDSLTQFDAFFLSTVVS